jgi:hypothetical protein
MKQAVPRMPQHTSLMKERYDNAWVQLLHFLTSGIIYLNLKLLTFRAYAFKLQDVGPRLHG